VIPPDALLLLSTHCPHCPAVLASLAELVKAGTLGRLEIVNLEVHPEVAQRLKVQSVPWVRLGPFELPGVRTRQEYARWAARVDSPEGMSDYFHELLKEARLPRVLELLREDGARLAHLLPLVANPEASLNVRLGAGVALEEYAGKPELAALADRLGELARHADARVRADACHYLGLSGARAARPGLETCLNDPDAEVREIARESLDALDTTMKSKED
jgi:thiol-disulfide isomerase/thioredoxin